MPRSITTIPRLRIQAKKPDEAGLLFKSSLPNKEKDADKRKSYTLGFLKAMANAGKAVAGYESAADSSQKAALDLLATSPERNRARTWELRPLVAAHSRKQPNDPLLPFYQGEVAVQEGNYDLAEKAFKAGLTKPPDQLIS